MHKITKKIENLFILILFFLSSMLILQNCATTSFSYKKLAIEPKILTGSSKIFSSDSQLVFTHLILWLPGEIVYYDFIDSLNAILIKYSNYDKTQTLLLYDLSTKKPLWQAKGHFYVDFADKNNLILKYRYTKKIYDINTGNYIRDIRWPNALFTLYFWNNNALIFDYKNISFVNLRTGNIKWRRKSIRWDGYIWGYGQNNWFYFTANGLHRINIKDGDGWDYEASMSHKAYGKYIARETALTILAVLGGGVRTSSSGPDLIHNACTKKPLIINNKVYFAARDKLFCLDKNSGNLIWESDLGQELGLMDLFKVSENEIALVSYGLKYVNYQIKLTVIPSLRIFNLKTGGLKGLIEFNDSNMILNIRYLNKKFYILMPRKFNILDSKLNLLFSLDTKEEKHILGKFLIFNDILVVQAYDGIYTISDSSLKILWHKKLPPLISVKDTPKWKFPYYLSKYLSKYSIVIDSVIFIPSDNGYSGFSLKNKTNIINLKNIQFEEGDLSLYKHHIIYRKNKYLHIYSY